jgi:hypothetical protein
MIHDNEQNLSLCVKSGILNLENLIMKRNSRNINNTMHFYELLQN